MKPAKLLLRCYANKDGDQWQAFCIDFSLAAQGDSFHEVKSKLVSMISEYIYDALAGEDKEYASQLLNRRAPIDQFLTYYFYALKYRVKIFRDGFHKRFKIPMPLVPQSYVHE